MTHEEYERAANHWVNKDKEGVKMPKDELLEKIEEYIKANNTCALATGSGDFVRCTPIEYSYYNQTFFIFTEGGEKFRALEHNKNVCIAIYDRYGGFGELKGMQIMAQCEVVKPFSEEYINHASYKKIPIDVLKKLEEPMNLLKITPKRIDYLCSDFKKSGYNSRQSYEF